MMEKASSGDGSRERLPETYAAEASFYLRWLITNASVEGQSSDARYIKAKETCLDNASRTNPNHKI
jgi:hypothetical protein